MKYLHLFLIGLVVVLSSCSKDSPAQDKSAKNTAQETEKLHREVNVYSARHYDTDLDLYKKFTAKTNIKVNLTEAKSDELIAKIQSEGEYSPADLLVTVDAGRLYRAEEKGLFAKTKSEVLEQRIPAHLRHPDGLWFGLSKRARVIIYNKEKIDPEPITTYADLANPQYKKQVCMRTSTNIYNLSLLASIISHQGKEKAQEWANGVVANFYRRPQGNDTANIRDVESGQCGLSVVNSYYIARVLVQEPQLTEKIGIIFPNQKTTGTHVNISGAGIIKTAPNRENALKLLEFLTEQEAQHIYVSTNQEYPIVKDTKGTSTVQSLGEFVEDDLNASILGVHQKEAVEIYDIAKWY